MSNSQNVFQRLRGSIIGREPAARTISGDASIRLGDGNGNFEEFLVSALRQVLTSGVTDRRTSCETRQLLRKICDAARANDTTIENVLILLKETWALLPETRVGPPADAQATLSRIVSICIEEYYAGQPPS
jgi:hypothetical protein